MRILFLFMILSFSVMASAPDYIIPNSQGSKSIAKSGQGDRFKFDLETSKSFSRETKVREIDINGQKFSIALQDAFDSEGEIPFFQVAFPKDEVSHQLYAFLATRGSSGSQYHYFFRKPDGIFVYSGLHPEIVFDNETKSFVSYEKDGPSLYVTNWQVKNYHFVSTSLKQVNP